MRDPRVEALQKALALDPNNHALRLILAETLQSAGETAAALAQYDLLFQSGQLPRASLIPVGMLALEVGDVEFATACLNAARYAGVVEGIAELQAKVDARYAGQGLLKMPLLPSQGEPAANPLHQEPGEPITFANVGGLEAVKKTIHRMIILPFLRPDLYQQYKRRSGGGVLLYGPPGCGKTMLARATAGECGLPFFNIRIEEILDPYIGVSERNLNRAFRQARASAPCVLFLDELDALAFARRKQHSNLTRTLVDQLLQELDAMGADNEQLLVLAATNVPWDVDDAMLRPGRFDQRVFVPPPDEPARVAILRELLAERPTQGVDVARLARDSALFSGADLAALVERAVDLVIDEALDTGRTLPLTMKHLERARAAQRPTTVDWLQTAENYVEFANHDNRYDEVGAFLRSPEVRKHRKR